MSYIIHPTRGVNDLIFGMTFDQVEKVWGQPEEIEKEQDEFVNDVTWYYKNSDIFLTFDEEDDYKLGLVEISNQKVELFGENIIGMPIDDLKELMEKNEIQDFREDQELDNETLYTSDELGLDFWLEDGKLTSIQIGPYINNFDEIEWPELEATS